MINYDLELVNMINMRIKWGTGLSEEIWAQSHKQTTKMSSVSNKLNKKTTTKCHTVIDSRQY
jgi:hypothetical protein